ncbi:MAG: 16S rRNA (adenine(1518)-N(6)/adenine(1519)-N(6))-dimethyltransferase RsmA [Actinobacteria bacterium]|nr:16S rRNA (adenine(1518)-N(6)/adenine(1519)-N(6))-dimethyltransferase RsmA [Actinomycetota bacterium]MBT3688175.1 16S rRNA (adenine(1518)-N(6)/adenine(1519)-N(6))-dimethyltransferase RsmA [Actinomycetota bacterium]MBT4037104.1 16S rRNA (adenine(1518)-N(6)/adenine(1519)-N(6))-dimethyltransferase RsmA [Actinomycetota bacterium]MBT4279574.1 16S rRNA (adenine(1518)-N(6)/adenine(1519)-N(6))-dimethyltransferase RsmA [Actinomycetota bacterium]MBT4342403.1 16S rRNA (adenine(1518)-N(6)/adenine(1519)-N
MASGRCAAATCRNLARVTLTRTQVRSLLDRHGISPKRSLGQNFVVEPNTVRRIAELAEVGEGDRVVEIGPGVGSLTLALLEAGASVVAIEVDDVLVDVLAEVTAGHQPDRIRIVHGDAMDTDWDDLLGAGPWKLVANLPYNISVPLICDLLDGVPAIGEMVVMVQREVADRLVAGPGDDAYGLPSVKVAYHAEARVLGRVPPSVFLPRPRVDSALVGLRRLSEPATDVDREVLFQVVRAGFGQRRKMLRRSLRGILDEAAIVGSGVDPTARAEELGLDQWASMASRVVGDGS